MDKDSSVLRRLALQLAGETSGLLRDLSCTEKAGERVEGETIRADILAEDYIIDTLRMEGFRGTIVTEERGIVKLGDEEIVALVDPLDGSRNYSNCIPWSSVSIAFAPLGKRSIVPSEIIAGAIAPVFYGEPLSFDHEGCYLGNNRVERQAETPFIYVYIEHPEAARGVARIIEELGGGFKIRSLGSAALEIAYVGIGRGTAFIDLRPKIRNVDIAAASGLASRCGVYTLTTTGSPVELATRNVERLGPLIVASRPRANVIVSALNSRSAAPANDHSTPG